MACSAALLSAQTSNDECIGAIPLTLGTPTACPNSTSVTNIFNVSNVSATPTMPYPTFSNCAIGDQTSSPADEVWFSFVPTGNTLSITVGTGLNSANIAIFTGSNCASLTSVECASGTVPLSLTLPVMPNQQYYMMISGGTIGDQSNFTLAMTSSQDCNQCLQSPNFIVSPPPLNGTYNSGQTVYFCFIVNQWNVIGTIEWLHALEVDFGPGWDISSFVPNPPPSCDGQGYWGWYNSWVSCATGQTFGPGFAYDSAAGLGCGGTPNDGNPGNNWGDGNNGCANIGGSANPSVTFCWSIRVGECPPNTSSNSLSIIAKVLSDGDSGSWPQVGCNSGNEYKFLASAVCCDDGNPMTSVTPTFSQVPAICSGGSFTLPTTSNNGIAGSWLPAINNMATTTYTFTPNAGQCASSTTMTVIVNSNTTPVLTQVGPLCVSDTLLTLNTIQSGITGNWSGPGVSNNSFSPATAGTGNHTLSFTPNADQCANINAISVTVNPAPIATITATGPVNLCPGGSVILTASQASAYQWNTGATSQSIIVNAGGNYSVSIFNDAGCFANTSLSVSVMPVASLSLATTNTSCGNSDGIILANVSGGSQIVSFAWSNGATTQHLVNLPGGTYAVTATDVNGCTVTAQTMVISRINPTVSLGPDLFINHGQQILLTPTATGSGLTYSWSTGANTPTITINAAGIYSVTVTNQDGCSASASVAVTVVSSTSDRDNRYKIKVFPNPTTDVLYIQCDAHATESVRLMNIVGKRLLEDATPLPDGAIRTLRLYDIPEGSYFIEVIGSDFRKIVPVIKTSSK